MHTACEVVNNPVPTLLQAFNEKPQQNYECERPVDEVMCEERRCSVTGRLYVDTTRRVDGTETATA